ncbi:MAG: FlgD immunoglobulin-like domain containing protein [bacterium]|jgi:hypothetical protein|nr:hypothetical protein [candidate division KSB1 bacterium]MDH7559085.1 FlgD immunoglobulin-like domain containing protein [bacterium]
MESDTVIAIGTSYGIEPAGLRLSDSVLLEASYSERALADLDEERLELAIRESDGWRSLGGVVDKKTDRVTLLVDQLGEYRLQWNQKRRTSGSFPSHLVLLPNYPNPFNPTTTLHYGLPERFSGWVELGIYDAAGREVCCLVDEPQNPGYYSVVWDGRDSSGRQVPSGVYCCRLRANRLSIARKMIFLR